MKIKLLDLCCKAGGCSMGYYQAAKDLGHDIEIVGVDIEYQPNYPFDFIQADAGTYAKEKIKYFTHVHASPPCQKYSVRCEIQRQSGKVYRDNLQEIKQIMIDSSLPGVIENVVTAPIKPDIVLRGDMFGLKVLRKRHFELINWWAMKPMIPAKKGSVKNGDFAQVVGNGQLSGSGKDQQKTKIPGNVKQVWSTAMGIDWMDVKELAEAIPPAYTRYIGHIFFKS